MNPNLIKAIIKGVITLGGTVGGIFIGNATKKTYDSAKKDFSQFRSEVKKK